MWAWTLTRWTRDLSLNTPSSLPLPLLPPHHHALALIDLRFLSPRCAQWQRLPPESNHSHVAIPSTTTTTKTHRTQTPSPSYSSLPPFLPVTWTWSGTCCARASCGDELVVALARAGFAGWCCLNAKVVALTAGRRAKASEGSFSLRGLAGWPRCGRGGGRQRRCWSLRRWRQPQRRREVEMGTGRGGR